MKKPSLKKLEESFAFFGSSRFSVIVLDELERNGLTPRFIVTTRDKPQGRKMILTPTPVKEWAMKHKIKVFDPAKLTIESIEAKADLFVVASYGKIIPPSILDLPKQKTLNIHPSLLPKYRGASPLQSAMLDDTKDTGVTIMQIDAEMDHGPIVAQQTIHIDKWPSYTEFETMMATKGAKLLSDIYGDWCAGKIQAIPQDHHAATFTKKIKKEDGLIDFSIIKNGSVAEQYLAFRKIQAFHEWPKAYFLIKHNDKEIRVKITQASWKDGITNVSNTHNQSGKLVIEKVTPEGSKEMTFEDFSRGYKAQ